MAKVMITGVAGFIGSNVAESFLKNGYEVIGIDNFSTGKKDNLKSFINNISFKKVDITNMNNLKKIMKGVDYVLHFAALPSVPYSMLHTEETHLVNIKGTFNVLMAAHECRVKKVIFPSSAAVYGETTSKPVKETDELKPISHYAAHKITGEIYCRAFYNIFGLRTTALRLFNVFGPRQNPNATYAAVIPKFISLMKEGKRPIIFGDGLQTRDFINVDDISKLCLKLFRDTKSDGKVYNVASGEKITILELVDSMNKVLGTNIKPILSDVRPGDVKHSLADISKISLEIGFKPCINLEKGLRNLI